MLAIAGGKGGCGKTTTTFGLATDMARRGTRVLAVDADRDMPDLHALAGVPNDPTIAAVTDGSTPMERIRSVTRPAPADPRVGVVPTAPGVERGELRRGLELIGATASGPTLVDCPAGGGPAAVDPLRIADRVLVVTRATPASLRDAVKTVALARAVGTPVVGAVVTAARSVPDGVERLLGTDAVAVPETEDPITDPESRERRRTVVGRLWG